MLIFNNLLATTISALITVAVTGSFGNIYWQIK